MSQVALPYYDLKVQSDELDRKLEELKSKSRARAQEEEKLSLFYQKELEEWICSIDEEKIIWQQKREHLCKSTAELQESIKSKWSSASVKLNKEKEKYCNVIIKLLPEWQKVIERKQMKEISEYESKLSSIEQRRRNADIAFEKEKKLLSLLSFQQKQIQQLENEEKQEAINREHERKIINQQQNETLIQSKANCFADIRLQQHLIRKQVTSELEKKFTDELKDIKTKLLQNNLQISTPTLISHNKPLKTLLNDAQKKEENQEMQKEIEEKAEIQEEEKDNEDQEGNETAAVINEEHHIEIEEDADGIKIDALEESNMDDDEIEEENNMDDTSKIERAVGLIEINHHKSSLVSMNNIDKDAVFVTDIKQQQSSTEQIRNAEPQTITLMKDNKQNIQQDLDVTHNEPQNKQPANPEPQQSITLNKDKKQPQQQEITRNYTQSNQSSKVESKLQPSHPRTAPTKTKLKRSFRARTSKNRLAFSVLESPKKESKIRTQNMKTDKTTKRDELQQKLTFSDTQIKVLNDFEDDNPVVSVSNQNLAESSDDDFAF